MEGESEALGEGEALEVGGALGEVRSEADRLARGEGESLGGERVSPWERGEQTGGGDLKQTGRRWARVSPGSAVTS